MVNDVFIIEVIFVIVLQSVATHDSHGTKSVHVYIVCDELTSNFV